MNKLTVFMTFIFCWLTSGIIFGQNYSYRFDYLNTEHGLSDNNVNCIYQDKTGYIWIGTANGLNRYDGKEIVVFRSQNNDHNSLPNNNILTIAEDRNNNIWIGTWNGLACFYPAKKLFQRFELNGYESISAISEIIHKVICAADGKIYVGASHGLFVSDEPTKSFRFIEIPEQYRTTGTLPAVAHYGMEEDTVNKGIWLSSGSFMLFYDYAHQRFYHHYFNPMKWPMFNDIMNSHYTIDGKNNLWGVVSKYRSIIKYNLHSHTLQKFPIEGTFFKNSFVTVRMDEKEKLWIGTWNSFPFLFDTKTLQLDSSLLTNPSDKPLSSGRISCLITDREKNIWIGTSKGVSVFHPRYNSFEIFTVNEPQVTRKDIKMLHLYPESDSVAWVGTSNGLYYYNLLNHKRRNFLPGNLTGNTMFYNITPRNKNELWIGTGNGLLSFNKITHRFSKAPEPIADATNLDSVHVQVVLYDKDSTLWISTWFHGLYRINKDFKNIIHYSTVGNVSVKKIVCNYYDDGNIYFGLNGRMGIVKYNARLDSFIVFNNQKENPLSQFPNAVNCINFFNDSLLLAGTFGNGLFIYNTRSNSMTNISSSHGLYSDYISNVIPIDSKSVFISTSGGISVYDFETKNIYGITDYVSQRDRDYVNTGIQDAHGNIYCYALNSFIRFHPRDFIVNKQKPEVVINRMKVMMRDADSLLSEKNIRLDYDNNSLAFGFSALTFTHPAKTEFAYKLEGLDEDWNYSGSSNFVSYAHLRPGNYVFKVKAANSDKVWNESDDSIAIFIAAPYWQTAWFKILIMVFIAGVIYTVYKYQLHKKIEKLKAVELERKRISADLHDDLGSTLTKISLMSQVAANIAGDKQQQTLRKISADSSDMVDKMNGIIWALNTENDTLPNLIAYIRKHAHAMFEDSTINLIMNIPELVEEIPVSGEVRRNIFLVVKEALHNALKYSQATEVRLSMEMQNSALNIIISDNGKGFVLNGKPTGGGAGIANMKKRMKESGTFNIASVVGKGTTVQLFCQLERYTKV